MNGPEQTHLSEQPAKTQDDAIDSNAEASPRADLHDAIGWVILGLLVVIASLRMSRLEDRHINPLTVPGLVPGLLGAAMVIVGTILGVRSWLRITQVQRQALPRGTADDHLRRKRVLLAVVLCCGYSLVMIGHGLSFWLASSIYVTVSILAFDHLSADSTKRKFNLRAVIRALLIGVISSVTIWLAFERLFLVRLP
ncbi:MAG: tripartite tricarboxylate transporter TctB family protein [Rhodoferax sp.]